MRTKLTILILLLAPSLKAATGDIIGAAIETNGWQMLVWIENTVTNATVNTGLASTNKRPENATIVLSWTTEGFTTNGTATTYTMTGYGTKQVRKPYPDQAVMDIVAEGSNVKLRIALSEYITASATGITVNLPANMYQSSAAATSLAVTNNSTIGHGKTFAKWTDVPWQYVGTTNVRARLQAYGHGPRNGAPVAAVKFWATDGVNVSPTNIVRVPTIDTNLTDAVPIQEYISDLDVSGLTDGLIYLKAKVFPWRGTEPIDDETFGASYPTPYFAPFPVFLSKADTYIRWAAVVDPAGNNSTAVIQSAQTFDSGSPPAAFTTIGAAVNRMISSNNTHHSRSEIGGSVIYVKDGNYSMSGATHTSFTIPETWVTVKNFPGHSNVVLTGSANTRHAGHKTKIEGLTFGSSGSPGVVMDNLNSLWVEKSTFAYTNTTTRCIDTVTNVFLTRSTMLRMIQGANAASTDPTAFWLVRGNDWSGWTNTTAKRIQPHTATGNRRGGAKVPNSNSFGLSFVDGGNNTPDPIYPLISFNVWRNNDDSAGDLIQLSNPGNGYHQTNGLAVIMNVVEYTGSSTLGNRIASICSSSQVVDDEPQDNAFLWHNVFVGQRFNCGENAGGNPGVSVSRQWWSVLNNLFDQVNTKHDKEYNPSGTRTGGWPVAYGVGWKGNTDLNPPIDSSWFFEFIGVPGFDTGATWSGTGYSAPWATWNQYVNRGSYVVSGAGAGNSNYRLEDTSPVYTFLADAPFILPHDLDGNTRNSSSPPGAYADDTGGTPPPDPPDPPSPGSAGFSPVIRAGTANVGTVNKVN
jgi:hypothetical protein